MPQSLAKVYIHAIFSTKKREPMLADAWRDELFHVLGGARTTWGANRSSSAASRIMCICSFNSDARSRSPMRWGRSSRPHQHG